MFGRRFFGGRFYAARYFGDGGTAAPADVDVSNLIIQARRRRRR